MYLTDGIDGEFQSFVFLFHVAVGILKEADVLDRLLQHSRLLGLRKHKTTVSMHDDTFVDQGLLVITC